MIYVIGHKNPDTDTVISSITYSYLMGAGYEPVISGELNAETKFVLEKFNINSPEKAKLISDSDKFFLVDHNEKTQRFEGITEENVVGILDHHKIDFCNSCPINITVKPYGSCCTIISEMFFDRKIELDKNIAGALLSGILSDTIIFKSPTCTQIDIDIANKLANIAGILDVSSFGMELFAKKAEIQNKSDIEIINNDFKDFDIKGKKIGVSQLELTDVSLIMSRKEDILGKMENMLEKNDYFSVILMVTDIIKEGSYLWIVGDKSVFELFENDSDCSKFYPGIMSRKKQILPKISTI